MTDTTHSVTERMLLVSIRMPDGLGTPDPERTTDDVADRFRRVLHNEYLVPTPQMVIEAEVRQVYPGDQIVPVEDLAQYEDLRTAVRNAAQAAYGDSNDEEIDNLRLALDEALAMLGLSFSDLTEGITDPEDES